MHSKVEQPQPAYESPALALATPSASALCAALAWGEELRKCEPHKRTAPEAEHLALCDQMLLLLRAGERLRRLMGYLPPGSTVAQAASAEWDAAADPCNASGFPPNSRHSAMPGTA